MTYVLRRLAWGIAVLWFVLSATFALVHLVPADPARAAVGPHASAQTVARVRAAMCLDRSVVVQYGCFVGRLARGDFGTSFRTRRPVATLLRERAWPTLELALAAIALQLCIGVPLGILAALRRRRPIDWLAQAGAALGQAAPTVFLGPLLLWLFAYRFPLFPVGGSGGLAHLVLPALTLAAGGAAYLLVTTRAEMIAALSEDAIRTARAKGLRERTVALRHALPLAAGPIATLLGLELGALAGGALFVESIFAWPGLGREAVSAILGLDLPVVLGVVLCGASAVVLVNLVVDLLYVLIDPRVTLR